MRASVNMAPILAFLEALGSNNNKTWFEAHRDKFQEALDYFKSLVAALIDELSDTDGLGELSPKDCIFRLNRDIRFSKDKTPYKIYMSAAIGPGGRKSRALPYYVQIGPHDKSMFAGGVHQPSPQQLTKWRQAIDAEPAPLKMVINNPTFVRLFGGLAGERLTGAPKGYSREHLEIELLKLKQLTVMHPLADQEVLASTIVSHAVQVFTA